MVIKRNVNFEECEREKERSLGCGLSGSQYWSHLVAVEHQGHKTDRRNACVYEQQI